MIRPPSRLELMRFADGELDEARSQEIERWLDGAGDEGDEGGDHDGHGQAFIASVDALGDVLRAEVAPRLEQRSAVASFDVSDAIMAALEATASPSASVAASPIASVAAPPRASAPAPVAKTDEAPARQVATAVLTPLASSRSASVHPLQPRPVHARQVKAGAGLLLATFAAAAGLLLWLNRGAETLPEAAGDKPETVLVASATSPSEDEPMQDDGTAVDSVDFGQHLGAIFYVPGSTRSTTTTVVWINDDEGAP